MSEAAVQEQAAVSASNVSAASADCDECVGSGGWFRYDPSLEDSPGRLYLSCLGCRGSGRTVLPRG